MYKYIIHTQKTSLVNLAGSFAAINTLPTSAYMTSLTCCYLSCRGAVFASSLQLADGKQFCRPRNTLAEH